MTENCGLGSIVDPTLLVLAVCGWSWCDTSRSRDFGLIYVTAASNPTDLRPVALHVARHRYISFTIVHYRSQRATQRSCSGNTLLCEPQAGKPQGQIFFYYRYISFNFCLYHDIYQTWAGWRWQLHMHCISCAVFALHRTLRCNARSYNHFGVIRPRLEHLL